MGIKVIVTGATGMVGKGVLLECLDDERVDEVLSIGRNSLEMDHPKLKELIHANFEEFETVKEQLTGYDAAYLCMGVSAVGMNEQDYTHLTYDYTMALAQPFYALNPDATLIYVSGVGTDSSEKGRTMWARVKGKTENDLLAMGFKQAFAFRPGGIIPKRGIKSRTRMYQFFLDYFMWMLRFFRWLRPHSIVTTQEIGWAMLNATLHGYSKQVILPPDIHALQD